MGYSSTTTERTGNGRSGTYQSRQDGWIGLSTIQGNPVSPGVAELALYSELWSKLRWALGNTFHLPYGKREPWAGELARRLALVVMANRPVT